MSLIYNATNEVQSVKALGNWFTLKPGQIKQLEEKIAHFLATERADHGLVALPDAFEDPSYLATPEGQAELEKYKDKGVESYINFHRRIIANNQLSLRQDLEKANIKADPATFASEGEIRSMEIVASYQRDQEDKAQKRVDRVKELLKQTGKK